eukprot:6204312-Pleurochrysis_carterae.AAC.2
MCATRRRAERAVRARKQRWGVCGVGTCTTGGRRAHMLPCALRAARVVLGMGVACMAAAGAGVLQLSALSVLASEGNAGLAKSAEKSAAAASLVLRSIPEGGGEGMRARTLINTSPTCQKGRATRKEAKSRAKPARGGGGRSRAESDMHRSGQGTVPDAMQGDVCELSGEAACAMSLGAWACASCPESIQGTQVSCARYSKAMRRAFGVKIGAKAMRRVAKGESHAEGQIASQH